jgi:hypothetical protein
MRQILHDAGRIYIQAFINPGAGHGREEEGRR